MTTTNPPEFYFTGIQYNPEFYVSTSTSPGITQTVGDSRYLIKTQSDSTSASAIETFNGGIKTSSIDTPTAGTLTLGGTNCTGITFSDNISSLTLANNQYITTGTNTVAPTVNQIGYTFKLTNFYTVDTNMISGTDYTVINTTNFPAGTWLIAGSTALTPTATTTIQAVNVSITQGGLNISSGGNYAVNTTIYPFISGTFFSTGSTTLQIIYRVIFGVSTLTVKGGQSFMNIYATRIA